MVATARTLPLGEPLAPCLTSESSPPLWVLPTSGTTTRWSTGVHTALRTLPAASPLATLDTSPRLSGRVLPRSDVPLFSAQLAVSCPSPLGTPSATITLPVSFGLLRPFLKHQTNNIIGNFGGRYGENVLPPTGAATVSV